MTLIHACVPRETPRPVRNGKNGPVFYCATCGGKISLTHGEAQALVDIVDRQNAPGGDA